MQFDWTTFILEMLNFLVLVWLLKRFLYRPVLVMLDARQQRIQAETARADEMRKDAEALRSQYEDRLTEWNREREQNRQQLNEELAQARSVGMDNLKKSMADEEAKARARNEAQAASHEAALLREAVEESYGKAAAMLKRLASPALTQTIAQIFVDDLANLKDAERAALQKAAAALVASSAVEVASAHALDETARNAITEALSQAAGKPLIIAFNPAPELIAGLRAVVGECLLEANLADELAFFRHRPGEQ